MHIHLDPVGGVAGDMFAAALLDAWPEHAGPLRAALARLDLPPGVVASAERFDDGILAGRRFLVSPPERDAHHRAFRDIRAMLLGSALEPAVARRAVAIFAVLAEAEGRVHGVPAEDVSFHEVGAWDSIVDIVAAAFLVEALGPCTWSVAPVPIGSGRVRTAHGELPVPPPATALLLEGFPVFDDGRPGERTTPTGAAILRQLAPGRGMPRGTFAMGRVGHGFGTKRFKGISNVLRVACFAPSGGEDARIARDEVGVIRFEVDDQAAEDLAVGLERLRAMQGVVDVLQAPAFGKKGRMVAQVQVIARAGDVEAVAAACLAETSTLGLRIERAERRILAREATTRDDGAGGAVRVKTATRPDGTRTAKAEMDDVAAAGDHAARTRLRRRVEDA